MGEEEILDENSVHVDRVQAAEGRYQQVTRWSRSELVVTNTPIS